MEFCEDLTDLRAWKHSEPTPIANLPPRPDVARFTLIRSSSATPWKIREKAYYEASETCEQHFGK